MKSSRGLQVGPAVCVENGAVHLGVQFAELSISRHLSFGRVVEAIVGLRQVLVVRVIMSVSPKLVVALLADLMLASICCHTRWKWEMSRSSPQECSRVVFNEEPRRIEPRLRGPRLHSIAKARNASIQQTRSIASE